MIVIITMNHYKCLPLLLVLSVLTQVVQASQFIQGPVKLQANNTCHLLTFIPFTDRRAGPPTEIAGDQEWYGFGEWSSEEALGKASFSLMAAALMAKDHFNQRDPAVVSKLAELGSCDITFPETWFIDSGYSRQKSVDQYIHLTRNVSATAGANPDDIICAVIGPVDPRANEGVSVLSEHAKIPQIAYATIDKRLSRRDEFPTFVRGIPAGVDLAGKIATYMQRGGIFDRDYVAIIYSQSDYGEQFEDPLEDAEDELEYVTITEHTVETDPDSIESALKEAYKEGYHTIFFANNRFAILDDVAEVAVKLPIRDDDGEISGYGTLVGDEYLWIFTGEVLPPELFTTIQYEVDSPMDKLLRGAAIVTNYDPYIYEPTNDKFLNAFQNLDSTFLERLKKLHPLRNDITSKSYFDGGNDDEDYFQNTIPAEYASFLYDAIITAGLAACHSQSSKEPYVDSVLKSNFVGASGNVIYKKGENSRETNGVKFGVYYIKPGEINKETNTRGYTRHLHAIYDGAKDEWEEVSKFIFYDGTTNIPHPVRKTFDYNYLNPTFTLLGIVLVGISLLNILITTLWICIRRKERVVTASQPQFLYLLCFGAALQATSLIFLSFDENSGWTKSQLDISCQIFPWFFTMGYLLQYCALFSKLLRLSKLLSLRRRAVNMKQILLPFALIILASIIILILWQIFNPLLWERKRVHDDIEAPWISYGDCGSDDWAIYISLLGAVFGIIIIMTLAISWKMRNVQSELSESKWIFIAIFSHVQIWIIGVPCYFILNEVSRDASYLITMALIFIFSNAFVCFVIWPKMIADVRKICFGEKEKKKIARISVSGASTHISGMNNPGAGGMYGTSNNFGAENAHPSVSNFDDNRLQMLKLEAENEKLRSKLGEVSTNFAANDNDDASPDSGIPSGSMTQPQQQMTDMSSDDAGSKLVVMEGGGDKGTKIDGESTSPNPAE